MYMIIEESETFHGASLHADAAKQGMTFWSTSFLCLGENN